MYNDSIRKTYRKIEQNMKLQFTSQYKSQYTLENNTIHCIDSDDDFIMKFDNNILALEYFSRTIVWDMDLVNRLNTNSGWSADPLEVHYHNYATLVA